MKTRDLIKRMTFFVENGFKPRGSGRYLMSQKKVDEHRTLMIEADLHRKFGEWRFALTLGIRFESIERQFHALAGNDYGVEENPLSFTLYAYMMSLPSPGAGPDLWTFQANETEVEAVAKSVDEFLFEHGAPFLEHIEVPQQALDWLVANRGPDSVWHEAIHCYFLAREYGLVVPEAAYKGIFSCIAKKDIGESVCQRLVNRDGLKDTGG